ncbi:hypothetical protein CRE_01198 [Caenorhabditis remanei]|uniref:Uncharacterized protein n=1 Tax=Caenorhabditis remanei TaxID=31234 RepID=E3MWI1_CAERE|nr:hypothetical protein CRE_01198 [Caenorhabditis remanei]
MIKNIKKTRNVFQHAAEGGVIGAFRNYGRYNIRIGGRKSNIVNVYDNAVKSSRGNSKWFARIDKPHGKVPFYHINVNKAITGVKDPHTKISSETANLAAGAGRVLNVVNKMAPAMAVVAVAIETVQFYRVVAKDINNGSTRNTLQKTVSTAAAAVGGYSGYSAGASIGTVFLPGVGAMAGGLFGAILGGAGAGAYAEGASEKYFDSVSLGIDHPKCKKCGQEFKRYRYKEGHQQLCLKCR